MAIQPDIKVLQEILSAVLENNKILDVNLEVFCGIPSLKEYINSEAGMTFSSALVKQHYVKRADFIPNLFRKLRHVGLMQENRELLENEGAILAIGAENSRNFLFIYLDKFIKYSDSLQRLQDRLNHLGERAYRYQFILNITSLSGHIKQLSDFFRYIQHIKTDFCEIQITLGYGEEGIEYKQIIELLTAMKTISPDMNSLTLSRSGGSAAVSLEKFKPFMHCLAGTPWVKNLTIDGGLGTLTKKDLLELITCFKEVNLNLIGLTEENQEFFRSELVLLAASGDRSKNYESIVTTCPPPVKIF